MPSTTPQRPENIPLDACFDEEDKQWEFGEKNAEGKRIGHWQYWRPDGTLLADEEWGDGKSRVCTHRYHPNGVISQYCEKDLIKDIWVGTIYWTKLDTESVEDCYFPSPLGNARRVEFDYNDKGHVVTERIFDKDGVQLTHSGTVFPAIPPNVAPNAMLFEDEDCWISCEHSNDGKTFYGFWHKWDRNGQLQEQQQFDNEGKRLRQDKYLHGQLWIIRNYNGDENNEYWYSDGVLHHSTLYRNNNQDQTISRYDDYGNFLYSERLERLSDEHQRRYDNDALVMEAKWSKEGKTPPDVKYFDGDRILLDYTSHGDGTGSFTLYKADGSVEATLFEDKEQEANMNGHWGKHFLPGFWDSYTARTMTNVEHIRSAFFSACEEGKFKQYVYNLPIPEHLDALKEFDWKALSSTSLDKWLVLFLGDDKKHSKQALDRILGEIEDEAEGGEDAAAYHVLAALIRLLPKLPALLQRRAIGALADIFAFFLFQDPDSPYDFPDHYHSLYEELRPQLPLLEKFALAQNNNHGQSVLMMLGYFNAPAVLRQRLSDAKASPLTRICAACALSECHNQSKAQRLEAIETFHRIFFEESDEHVRVILGLLISRMTKNKGVKALEINQLLLQYTVQGRLQNKLDRACSKVVNFVGGDFSDALSEAMPKKKQLECIALVINGLQERSSPDQAKDLETIFYTLFSNQEKTKLTDLHRKALLTIADMVDQYPILVNLEEIFRNHHLPCDSLALRELANRKK